MKFGERSLQKLRYAKAAAKQVEFGVAEEMRPPGLERADDLHYPSVHIVSEYAIARLEGRDGSELKDDLRRIASFYDAAASKAKDTFLDDGYWQLAMAVYFLLGNYGSAKVSASKVEDDHHYGHNAAVLTDLVRYLFDGGEAPEDLALLCSYLEGGETSAEDAVAQARALVSWESPEELFFGRVLAVVAMDAVSSSARSLLPLFTGVGETTWRKYLAGKRSSKLLWQVQARIGEAGVFAGASAFVQMPTGSGKTRSIELLLRSRIFAGKCSLAIVVAPLRALCSEIASDLRKGIGDVAEIKRSSEVFEVDSWLGIRSIKSRVAVFTPEKLGFVMHHEPELLAAADVFVFDEAHLIDSASRGPAYELLLAEIASARPDAQIVMISAVVSNGADIAAWALGGSGVTVSGEGVQVTEKPLGVLSRRRRQSVFGTKVSFSDEGDPTEEDYFAFIDVEEQELGLKGRERKPRVFPDYGMSPSHVARDVATYYANRLIVNGAAAVYVPKRDMLWSYFGRLSDLHGRGCSLPALEASLDHGEAERFQNLISLHYGEGCALAGGLAMGVLPHYGDLQGAIRQAVEHAVQASEAHCIACTSTLAEGVNLPIKYLMVTGVWSGRESPLVRDFQNLVGRAARSGKFSEGTVLITDPSASAGSSAGVYSRLADASKAEACESAILNLVKDEDGTSRGPWARGVVLGSVIVDAIIENISSPNLEAELAEAFVEVFSCDVATGRELAAKRVRALEAIEGYIAGAMAADAGPVDPASLCTATYAYRCADSEEKDRLEALFKAAHAALGTSSGVRLCAKARIGLRKAVSLQRWLEQSDIQEYLAGDMSDLLPLVEGFVTCGMAVDSRFNAEQLCYLAECWIGGVDVGATLGGLMSRFSFQTRIAPTPQTVERCFAQTMKYSLSHFAACVVDALEANGPATDVAAVENMARLRRAIKYGIKEPRGAVICEELFDDRMMASALLGVIGSEGGDEADIVRRSMMRHRTEIEKLLSEYPSYFLAEFEKWVGQLSF